MSVQAVNLLLGTGRLYAKRLATGVGASQSDGKYKLIGSVKGEAAFTYKPTFVEQRPSDTIVMVRRDKIEEMAQLKVTIVDWRSEQLRWALGMSQSTTGISATGSIRVSQEMTTKASTTTTQTLSRTAKSTTSVAFTSLDRATDYALSTDFTMVSKQKFKAVSAAFKGKKAVRAYYTKLFTGANNVRVGDQPVLQQVSLMYVHQQSNLKHICIAMPIATIKGDFAVHFKEKEYSTYDVTFEALGDPTLAKGRKLFSIIREP